MIHGQLATGVAFAAIGLAGCAADLARTSSSAIGCPADAIEVSKVSVGWSRLSWQAQCKGTTFYCSGESEATCAPELVLESRPKAAEQQR